MEQELVQLVCAFHDLAEAGGTGDAIIAASPQGSKQD